MLCIDQWFNDVGYVADIKACKEIHPGLLSYEQWLIKKDIKNMKLKDTRGNKYIVAGVLVAITAVAAGFWYSSSK